MGRTIPIGVPAQAVAGDTFEFDYSHGDFPVADGWTFHFALRGSTDFDSTATQLTTDGDTYKLKVPAASFSLQAGAYRWVIYFVKGSDRVVAEEGAISIRANPTLAVNTKSHAERCLEIIKAKLEGRLSADLENFTIDSRAVGKIPIAELQKLRGRYARLVKQERNGGKPTRSIEVTFVAP